jgi:hypothetical protein
MNHELAVPAHAQQASERSAAPHSRQRSASLATLYADMAISPSLQHSVVRGRLCRLAAMILHDLRSAED